MLLYECVAIPTSGERKSSQTSTELLAKRRVFHGLLPPFFRLTIQKVKPDLIVALGVGPAAFLSYLWPESLMRWRGRSIKCLDDLPMGRVQLEAYSAVCVAITHPSMPNSFRRRPPYKDIAGEIRLLKEARDEAEGKRIDLDARNLESSRRFTSESIVTYRPDRSPSTIPARKEKNKNLHYRFEQAFHSRIGDVLSRQEIRETLQSMFPDFRVGSVVPTDHAEPSTAHVNQCSKCANPNFRIFDTVVEGHGQRGIARYRVRDFMASST